MFKWSKDQQYLHSLGADRPMVEPQNQHLLEPATLVWFGDAAAERSHASGFSVEWKPAFVMGIAEEFS